MRKRIVQAGSDMTGSGIRVLVAAVSMLQFCSLYSTNYNGECHDDESQIKKAIQFCGLLTAQKAAAESGAASSGTARNSSEFFLAGCLAATGAGYPDESQSKGNCQERWRRATDF
ncbi:MAG: hypothetical protein JNM27_15470 [Leptospirales bacterium]|nr:hypothetical protein [Leptospirales bacterium]